MITVTESAREQIKAYFEGKEIKPIRIFLNNGCGGPQLAMALDDKSGNDSVHEVEGIEYLMDSKLLDEAKPVEIDYSGMGFHLKSSLQLSSGCSSCGTKGSCCS
ncbi:HesB-like domain protein [Desulfamplus magnetovallimortis]|uniref:HesB-like domain protein n=1 Tax=Desulfamplus magnetovallimortis TaxID=1246637 RepID=A0A1W1HG21_9BACT|nr:IscA/HesB family protein [Desulfamplus magnetovallimortis]SLM31363.1 HesB-like domain protein [Desulfamplus magnetovallimortis]